MELVDLPNYLKVDDFMQAVEASRLVPFSYTSVHYLERTLAYLQQNLGELFNMVKSRQLAPDAT